MGSYSDYLENKFLDHIFGCGTRNFTPPSDIYVALSTADPTDSGGGLAEPSGGSYARIQTDENDWGTAASGALSNAEDILSPVATANWGTITHFALFDAASGGNMLAHGALTASQAIGIGDRLRFAAGDLDVSQD